MNRVLDLALTRTRVRCRGIPVLGNDGGVWPNSAVYVRACRQVRIIRII